MSAALVVVILVAAGDAGDPETKSMTATAQAALGPDSIVVVREVDAMPSDDDAIRLEGALHASAVVEVTWPDPSHARAHVHAHVRDPSAAWADRDLSFVSADAPPERGRTVGFAVASMLPAPGRAEPPPPTNVAPPPPPPPPPPPKPTPPVVVAPPPRETVDEGRVDRTTSRAAFDVGGAVAFGFGGNAAGVGGEIGGRFALTSWLWGVGRTSAMMGDMESAQATSTTLRFAVGLALSPARSSPDQRVSWGVELGAGIDRHGLTRTTAGLPTIRGDRWIGVGQLRGELAWWFVRHAALVSSVGVELAFGTTNVIVDGATTTTIPVVRALGSIGIRTEF